VVEQKAHEGRHAAFATEHTSALSKSKNGRKEKAREVAGGVM